MNNTEILTKAMAVTMRYLELMPLFLVGRVWQISAHYIAHSQNYTGLEKMLPQPAAQKIYMPSINIFVDEALENKDKANKSNCNFHAAKADVIS